MPRKFPGSKKDLIKKIESSSFKYISERPICHGVQITFSRGLTLSFYDNKSLNFQGSHGDDAQLAWDESEGKYDE